MIDWVGFNVPLNTLQVISETGFYWSNDPTNSVKALKEVVVLRIGFNPTRSTSPCYNTTRACNVHKIIHTEKWIYTVKWAQWDKTQPRELLSVCISLCTLLRTILHRTDLIIFPLTLQTITIAPMMCIWGKGGINLLILPVECLSTRPLTSKITHCNNSFVRYLSRGSMLK